MVSENQPRRDEHIAALDLIPKANPFPLARVAWGVTLTISWSFAIFCTTVSVCLLLLLGFDANQTPPLLFWNIAPWLLAAQLSRRAVASQKARAAALSEAAVRRRALAESVDAARAKISVAASPNPTRGTRQTKHWWTDTGIREETKQRIGR